MTPTRPATTRPPGADRRERRGTALLVVAAKFHPIRDRPRTPDRGRAVGGVGDPGVATTAGRR
jgi:hypothetical protein